MDLSPKRPLLTAALVAAQLNESVSEARMQLAGAGAPTRRSVRNEVIVGYHRGTGEAGSPRS
jgi:hypothetical protein